MTKNLPATTKTNQIITHIKYEKKTTQSQSAENIIFDKERIDAMTATELRQQTKLRGIPISRKRKRFTAAENLNSIYTHDENMKNMMNTQKHLYAKNNPLQITITTQLSELPTNMPPSIRTDDKSDNKFPRKLEII